MFSSCQTEDVSIDIDHELKLDDLKKENLLLKRERSENDSVVNMYSSYINDIRQNLKAIRNQENLIITEKRDPENLNVDNTDLIEEIGIIGNLMAENERLIMKLKNGIKNADIQLNDFNEMVISLSEEVQMKNREIYDLQQELENLDGAFVEIFDAYTEKVSELDAAKDIINQGWYTFGYKDELYKNGVITKEGGFIGIGRISVLKDDFNKSYFTEIKINELTEVKLGVKSANLITSHPSDSYELVVNNQVEKLVIIDQQKFWSNSKYLVIIVK